MHPKLVSSWIPVLATLILLFPTSVSAQLNFVEVASTCGLTAEYRAISTGYGGGLSAADFDDDGDVDVFVPTTGDLPHRLYRNLGNGTFEEMAAEVGLGGVMSGRVALWLDYDGDHRLDLLVATDCYQSACEGMGSFLRLFRQTALGNFVETTQSAGLTETGHDNTQHRSGLAAGDVDGDGDLDLVVGFWEGKLHLYLNRGDGVFVRSTAASGLETGVFSYHQPVIQDFDGDGRMDIFAAVDFTENRLWQNTGNVGSIPMFTDVAASAGCDNAMNDMGVALGDFDQDGLPDLYVSNIYQETFFNILLKNGSAPGNSSYEEVSASAGVQDGGWGWGTTFFDGDNDGDLDLAETNGWTDGAWNHPMRIFEHQGNSPPTFVDQAASAGVLDSAWGTTVLGFDFDRDGDLDLFETVNNVIGDGGWDGVRLYRNELNAGAPSYHYLVVRPRMETGANHWAIGARVVAEVGSETFSRWIGAGVSYLGQEPAEAHFGLGSAEVVDRLTIHWPDGSKTIRTQVAVNQTLEITTTSLFFDGFESGDTLKWSATVP